MKYTITKSWSFAAGHHLPHLPVPHKCRRPHGHNYTVTVELGRDELDGNGMVVDYGELEGLRTWTMTTFDHQDLNLVSWPNAMRSTAEHLAEYIFAVARDAFDLPILAVTVSETDNTTATYRP